MDTAIDLSLRPREPSETNLFLPHGLTNSVIRPTPRPPWSILWYQNLLPAFQAQQHAILRPASRQNLLLPEGLEGHLDIDSRETCLSATERGFKRVTTTINVNHQSLSQPSLTRNETATSGTSSCSRNLPKVARTRCNSSTLVQQTSNSAVVVPVIDIACCDGPVHFERVSNPNFAVTVEHHVDVGPPPLQPARFNNLESSQDGSQEVLQVDSPDPTSSPSTTTTTTSKTYLCIYCNQSFKSLFCYQKHKKRHLNPVSVDITGVPASTRKMPSSGGSATDNRRCYSYNNKTRDLNVQFFPCKKCGSKFPSYYFVHKHKKACH